MQKRYYNAETLATELQAFEERFGIPSSVFYVLHVRHEDPEGIDPFDAFLWAQTYRDACRLRGGDTATAALQPAG